MSSQKKYFLTDPVTTVCHELRPEKLDKNFVFG